MSLCVGNSGAKVVCLVVLLSVAWTELNRAQDLYIIEHEGFYGFSDKSAKPLIAPRYGAVKPFSEGLAPVYQAGSWGFIDSEGKMQIEPDFWDADNFSDGLAAVHKGGWGYIDCTGKVVIPARYLQARRFSEGVAPVKSPSGWLFIDKTGRPIDGLSGFEDATSFSGSLAAVQVGGKWRFITREGQKKFELEFTTVSNFSEGLAAVQETKNGKYGFIDASGTYLIQPLFEDARPFAEGLAAVKLNKRWGYISKSGEMRISNRYPFFADTFAGGLALGRRGVAVYSRPLVYRSKTIQVAGFGPYTLLSGEEKGIDVRLALDVLDAAHQMKFDVALIFSQDQDLSELASLIRQVAKFQDRWIKIASAFPDGPGASNRRGINGTDWCPIDKSTYDACIDPRDYRPSL